MQTTRQLAKQLRSILDRATQALSDAALTELVDGRPATLGQALGIVNDALAAMLEACNDVLDANPIPPDSDLDPEA